MSPKHLLVQVTLISCHFHGRCFGEAFQTQQHRKDLSYLSGYLKEEHSLNLQLQSVLCCARNHKHKLVDTDEAISFFKREEGLRDF